MELAIKEIKQDLEIQQRVEMKDYIIRDYAEAIRRREKLPPVKTFFDGKNYWLADGFHRMAAVKKAGKETLEMDVEQGTSRDALLYALGANEEHGLRRSLEDKRKAVLTMLTDAERSKWSNREIARQTNTTHPFVGKLRKQLEAEEIEVKAPSHGEEPRSIFFCKAEGKGEKDAYKFGDPSRNHELMVQVKSYKQGLGIRCSIDDGKELFEVFRLDYDKQNPKKIASSEKEFKLEWDYEKDRYELKRWY